MTKQRDRPEAPVKRAVPRTVVRGGLVVWSVVSTSTCSYHHVRLSSTVATPSAMHKPVSSRGQQVSRSACAVVPPSAGAEARADLAGQQPMRMTIVSGG